MKILICDKCQFAQVIKVNVRNALMISPSPHAGGGGVVKNIFNENEKLDNTVSSLRGNLKKRNEEIKNLKDENEMMRKEIQQAVDGYVSYEFAYRKVEKYEANILGFKKILERLTT